MNLVSGSRLKHSAAILGIFNEAIENSTALYDYKPRPPESMAACEGSVEAVRMVRAFHE